MIRLARRRHLLSAVLCYLLAFCGLLAVADTEIRNFDLPLPPATNGLPPPPRSVTVHSGSINHNVSNVEPDLWLSWSPDEVYRSWTARLSWPASSPTKFDIKLSASDPSVSIMIHISSSALSPRISGIPFPHVEPQGEVGEDDYFTPFTLTLEPLILGVLPQTALPALFWIIIFGTGAACTVPTIRRAIESAHAWAETGDGGRKKA